MSDGRLKTADSVRDVHDPFPKSQAAMLWSVVAHTTVVISSQGAAASSIGLVLNRMLLMWSAESCLRLPVITLACVDEASSIHLQIAAFAVAAAFQVYVSGACTVNASMSVASVSPDWPTFMMRITFSRSCMRTISVILGFHAAPVCALCVLETKYREA
jgi:hypothetical protein